MQMSYNKNALSPIAIAKAAGCYGDVTKPAITHPDRFDKLRQENDEIDLTNRAYAVAAVRNLLLKERTEPGDYDIAERIVDEVLGAKQ